MEAETASQTIILNTEQVYVRIYPSSVCCKHTLIAEKVNL